MGKLKSGFGVKVLLLMLAVLLLTIGIFYYRERILQHLFPLDYRSQVESIADEYELDRWLVFAIIRVESSFKARAESSAGARGLMQLMPDTAQWIVESAAFEMTEAETWLPQNNIRLGCWYINWLRDYYNGDMVAGVAAYNAGIGNVNAWLEEGLWDGRRKTLAAIPFAETRRFVKNVYDSYDMYRRLYGE